MLTIHITSGNTPPVVRRLSGPRCIVGREGAADLPLSGWRVSKRHAELFVAKNRIYVRDLNSTFGTMVNDKRVDTYGPLKVDDKVRIGAHVFSVQWQTAAVELVAGAEAAPAGASRAEAAAKGREAAPAARPQQGAAAAASPAPAGSIRWRAVLHERLLDAFDVRRTDVHRMADDELRLQTELLIGELIEKLTELPPHIDRARLMREVRDEAIGLGPLEPLLEDPSVTEIMVNCADEIFIERAGRLERWPVAFTSDRAVLGIIERIVAPIGRRIDESSPMVDARLKDGSRVNAVISPLALKGPSVTIRKFSKRKLFAEDLVNFGSASPAMVEFMRVAVEQRKNVLISGGTGSGKTTLLNILGNFIPSHERVVTIEDAAELQLRHSNLVSLEARPANIEGKGQVTIRDLVKNSLRMRPDRIVVGECRGGEALDMLQAMNTGHDGSLTTAHANSPRDMLARIEVMVLMAGMDLPVSAIREQLASAVDIVVQQTRFACGSRKITNICEITGVETGKIQLQEIFAYVQTGVDDKGKTTGYYTGRGFVPEFYEQLATIGVEVDLDIFAEHGPSELAEVA